MCSSLCIECDSFVVLTRSEPKFLFQHRCETTSFQVAGDRLPTSQTSCDSEPLQCRSRCPRELTCQLTAAYSRFGLEPFTKVYIAHTTSVNNSKDRSKHQLVFPAEASRDIAVSDHKKVRRSPGRSVHGCFRPISWTM